MRTDPHKIIVRNRAVSTRYDLDDKTVDALDAVFAQNCARDRVLEILLQIRDRIGGITDAALAEVANRLNLSQAELYELATFYPALRYVRGEIEEFVEVCDDLVCALIRTPELAEALQLGRLGSSACKPGACRGACDRAPVTSQRGLASSPRPSPTWRHLDSYCADGGYAVLKRLDCGELAAEDILAAIEGANAFGRAGAAFPVARKWRAIRERQGEAVVIVNADEGELATFKDRYILEHDPHGVLEGALIAARVVDANRLIVYLRDEYDHLFPVLSGALAEIRDGNYHKDLQLELRRSGGAYICGEETALIASLEGRPARPREKPPFPTTSGLFGAPTLVHNVETFYRLRTAWGAEPKPDLPVTALLDPTVNIYSLSGRVARPGVYLMRSAPSLMALVGAAGGMSAGYEFGGVVLGGSAGSIVPAELCELPIGELSQRGINFGTSSVIVFGRADDLRWTAAKMASFLARESCGQCTPCRVGTAKMAAMFAGGVFNADLAADLALAMSEASICALGRGAGRFLARVTETLRERAQ